MEDAAPRLQKWCAWRNARQGADALGLGALAGAIESGAVDSAVARKTFEINYTRWWLNHAVGRRRGVVQIHLRRA